MGVSAVGASGSSVSRIRTVLVLLLLAGGTAFYFYGPVVTPALSAAAHRECNERVGGNFRSYQLQWVVSTRPHWTCGNRFRPGDATVSLGWWVAPGF